MADTLPARFSGVEELEEFMTRPSAALRADLSGIDEILVLGVGGKMGPTLARMAQRAGKRVIGVARFSEKGLREKLERWGIECLACDLLDRAALERLPRAKNVVFMAGHKFGAAGDPSFTWAMNVAVPFMVAETFRDARIVAFSTACVYPYVEVNGAGADEKTETLPPPGDYATSCVGREQMFRHASQRYGTPGRLVRLSYAIDMRYGVLYDVAQSVFAGKAVALGMGYANVIWQGDANEQALRLLAHCTSPASPINISGPKVSVRWLAGEFGKRFSKRPAFSGQEAHDRLANRHRRGCPAAWAAARAARDDDRLGRGLGEPRPAEPRQANALRNA